MPSPFRTKEFRALYQEWRERLAEDGFKDLEDHHGNLKTPDNRTNRFVMREQTAEFFRRLDHYLTETPEVPPKVRAILELYSEGIPQVEIARKLEHSLTLIERVTRFYRLLLKDR